MNPKAEALKKRTHEFFVRIIKLCDSLPQTAAARSIAEQLLDSAGSTDSNYRAACRARSKKEFIAKVGIANEEADESLGWLRALSGANLGNKTEVQELTEEAAALVRMFSKSILTAKANLAADNRQSGNKQRSIGNQQSTNEQ